MSGELLRITYYNIGEVQIRIVSLIQPFQAEGYGFMINENRSTTDKLSFDQSNEYNASSDNDNITTDKLSFDNRGSSI